VSLRLRLLLAVGAIAIVALVVADLATYSALRSSLYHQVDQELAQRPPTLRYNALTGDPYCPSPQTDSAGPGPVGSPGGAPDAGGGQNFPNVFGISYSGVVNQNGAVV
jgi:hypothetical protein